MNQREINALAKAAKLAAQEYKAALAQKNPKQPAKVKRAATEAVAKEKAAANSRRIALAARERATPPRGSIISGGRGIGGGLMNNQNK